ICFIPDNDYAGFIEENVEESIRPGNFVDMDGNVLGRHKGIIHYTIGQRKGLGISIGRPAYVLRIDPDRNEVVLGDNRNVFAKGLIASDLNFVSTGGIESKVIADVKIRYTAKATRATIEPIDDDKVKVVFDEPARAITPGQSAVFYDGDMVLGGGVIDKVLI
ncbi:MAG: tRNA 2-thiouridine(34) synthase MnmA, partial [Clostridiales bacterium]|nr:tRNA 2-thiouridine(34) synthase MnmA [Clostridiales bacterium]